MAGDAPVIEPDPEEVRRWNRRFAVDLFNRSWDLLEMPDRSADDDAEMMAAAFGSAWHWQQVGTAENIALGDHQISKVASHLGQPALALHYARRALEAIEIGHFGDWQVAAAYEGMARACAAAGDVRRARLLGAALHDRARRRARRRRTARWSPSNC